MDKFKKIVNDNNINYIPYTDKVEYITREQLYNCMKQAQNLVKNIAHKSSEIYVTYDESDGEVFCAFDDKERAEFEKNECGCGLQIIILHHGKRE